MAKGAAWFDQMRRQHLSVTVDYLAVGGLLPVQCIATVVDGRWEAIDAAGQIVRMETRDFFINIDDLSSDPQRGDTITIDENGIEETYEVSVPQGVQQAWRWSDRQHRIRRIHTTKRVDAFVGTSITTEAGDRITTEAGEALVI